MAILRFRIYWEEDESIYRDVALRHTQSFFNLHEALLKSFEFDSKHKATFYRSNDNWQHGREISLEVYDKEYKVAPLLMEEVIIGSEIKDPNQKFLYSYDFNKNWHFKIELIQVDKQENDQLVYPVCLRAEGLAPTQYGTKGLVDKRLAEMEEKYDLHSEAMKDGYGNEGEEDLESDEDQEDDEVMDPNEE